MSELGFGRMTCGWERTSSKYGVCIQRGTATVPDDDRFHVLVDGVEVLSTEVEAAAVAEFEDVIEQRRARRNELLREQRGDADFFAMRKATWADKSARDARKGGRGVGR